MADLETGPVILLTPYLNVQFTVEFRIKNWSFCTEK